VQMLAAIARGSMMGPGDGWFHPGQGLYGWDWLAARCDADGDGRVTAEEFRGQADLFERLDRDRSGAVAADDFDWSDQSPFVRQMGQVGARFRLIDGDGDGRLSRREWDEFFVRSAGGEDGLIPEQFAQMLLLLPQRPPAGPPSAGPPPGEPSRLTLVTGLLKGEVGSMFEGPAPGQVAPDFALATRDGTRRIGPAQFRGERPVVLIFGNFTCGPFRSRVSALEDLNRRYGDRAAFLAVYVREAHPTDGWRMESNDRLDIALPQPVAKDQRAAVAERCRTTLKMTMPLLVDEMDDRVGHAYSGMPARLYVLDRQGRVAYKSGRGPFGLKPGELEQALILTLLDQETAAPRR
jgi:hypothetical protein